VKGEFTVNELTAGYELDDDTFSYDARPNKAAESCAIRLYDDESYPLTMTWHEDLQISQTCMSGAVGCLGNDEYTNQDAVDADETGCAFDLIFTKGPSTIAEVKKGDSQNDSKSLSKMLHLFGTKSVDVTSVLICAVLVAVVLLLKMRFLWCPSATKKSSSDEVTPLMKENTAVYQ